MAKSRVKAVKRAGTRRKTASRKRGGARARGRYVALKPAYAHMSRSIAQLRRVPQTADVRKAIARLNRCLKEIDSICAPDMIIPISPAAR